jgi:tetratricopeptide (TPR) repeat protein
VQAHVGELAEARQLVERAIEVAVHDPQRAVGLSQLAVVELLENDLEAALLHANQALSLQRKARRWRLPGILANGYMLRGRIYRVLGNPPRALGSMQHAVKLAREAGERRLEMEATARLGGLLLDLNQPEEAETRLREALLIANEIEDRRGQTLAGLWLGTLLWEQSDPQAAPLLERASKLANEMGLARAEALALSIRARIAREAGDVERALELSERAFALIESQGGELPDRIVVTGTRALVLHAAGDDAAASEIAKELRRRMRKDNDRLNDERLRRSHSAATTRLLEAVLSAEGVIYPRVELDEVAS